MRRCVALAKPQPPRISGRKLEAVLAATMQTPPAAIVADPSAAQCQAAPRGFLLTMGSFLGTLAAARDLGRHGIPVVLADAAADTITAHSRFVTRNLRCPAIGETGAWVAWMMEFGQREPGHVLYPTTDNVCWLLDRHADALGRYFYLYRPRSGAMYELLNKRKLHAHCLALGIDQPETACRLE